MEQPFMNAVRLSRHARIKLGSARRLRASATVAALGAALLVAPAMSATAAVDMSGRVYVGSLGDYTTLETYAGTTVSHHKYASFSNKSLPDSRMITVNAGAAKWADVAAAKAGSTLYNDIARWGQTLKGRSGTVILAYQHEPETSANMVKGSSTDFKAAYRNVVSIIRAQGVTNVRFAWQMTAWAFRAKSTARDAAAAWYPGDDVVDIVGADAYNWYVCGAGSGKWNELQVLVDPVLAFSRAHGKQAALPEFGSHVDPRRSQWLSNAHAYIERHQSEIAAAFYFNRPPTNPANADCQWTLNTTAEYDAFKTMVSDLSFTK